jgi:hypothetical protein
MSSLGDDRAAPVSSPRLRLLARVIFGLTILGIAAGIWFSILDDGGFETDLAFLLSFCLFPIIGYILPSAGRTTRSAGSCWGSAPPSA